MGPEPLDAYLAFLQEAYAEERFRIIDAELEEPFWSFFREDQRHSFMPPGGEDEARAFTAPMP